MELSFLLCSVLITIRYGYGAEEKINREDEPHIETTTNTITTVTTPVPIPITSGSSKPPKEKWPGSYENGTNSRYILADWILSGQWNIIDKPKELVLNNNTEYEGYDGWNNNFARIDSGAIDQPLFRRVPADYEDGSYKPRQMGRPNPLTLSDLFLKESSKETYTTTKNAFITYFDQHVRDEIMDTRRAACPPEYFNIEIALDHPYKAHKEKMPYLRARYDQRTGYSPNNPRQQLNEATPYLDGGAIYGTTKQWADELRTGDDGNIDPDGCLVSSHDGLYPAKNTRKLPMSNSPSPRYNAQWSKGAEMPDVSDFFKMGNRHGNENPFIFTFGVLWFRWHNYLAKRIRYHNPNWSSDRIFNEARKWVIATQQNVVFYEWLDQWAPDLGIPDYLKYNPTVNPQIDQFFLSAASQYGHTLVVPEVFLQNYLRDIKPRRNHSIRTCNSFWLPHEAPNNPTKLIDIDKVLMGMILQHSGQDDHRITNDLRLDLYGPLEFPRRDLTAIIIQKARDHGVPDYNTAREAYGLDRIPNITHKIFAKLNSDVKEELSHQYEFKNIDVYIGGILETSDGPGELFKAMIRDQFMRIRDSDRFWFENKANRLFNEDEIQRIKNIKMYDIIMAVTKMDSQDIPKNPFKLPTGEKERYDRNEPHKSCVPATPYPDFMQNEDFFIAMSIIIVLVTLGYIGLVLLLIYFKNRRSEALTRSQNNKTRQSLQNANRIHYPFFAVSEWVSRSMPTRLVVVLLKQDKKRIEVTTRNDGTLLRALDFSTIKKKTEIYQPRDAPYVIIKCVHNYDLVLRFESGVLRQSFIEVLDPFLSSNGVQRENITSFTLANALKQVVTKAERQKLIEKFYRVVFSQAFKIKHSKEETLAVDNAVEEEIVNTELTVNEFADAMNMRANSEFIQRMFALIDKDQNGFISFREFVDVLIIFAKGTEKEKAKLLFDMYDVNATGYLSNMNFLAMIKSFLATVNTKVEELAVVARMETLEYSSRPKLSFSDFLDLFTDDIKYLSKTTFESSRSKSLRRSYLEHARDTIENIYEDATEVRNRFIDSNTTKDRNSNIIDKIQSEIIENCAKPLQSNPYPVIRSIELNSKKIFWITLYTLVLLAIFFERAYYYAVESEHSGLRSVCGDVVTVTRGAASAMMFTYSTLLLTKCRNTITYLRDSIANNYIPFDSCVEFHKYIAIWAFVFTVIHIVGHTLNFYYISMRNAEDVSCLFRNYINASHMSPKFQYWCWRTITGSTGLLLTLVWSLMYLFTLNIIRRKLFNWFWYTHSLYPLFYILMFLHGLGRFMEGPMFYYFFLGPAVLFTCDSIVSIGRKKVKIPVIRAEILPSNVLMLEFQKPDQFEYKSGQWVRIACVDVNKTEYHPFTLSSAPHEPTLTVHIRTVGPWTKTIRNLYDNINRSDLKLSKIYLDGPYGESHQNWNGFEITILIGGGIGVTPFASILKDIAHKSGKIKCQKVYFIWVSKTQRQFEWLVDVLREVEHKDTRQLLSCHIFITQFFEKFDLRTIFLYICERHYQRIANRSLFTNLRAVTHFGRPSFPDFFNTVSSLHQTVNHVGVFSYGCPSLTASVDGACNRINIRTQQKFEHYSKTF